MPHAKVSNCKQVTKRPLPRDNSITPKQNHNLWQINVQSCLSCHLQQQFNLKQPIGHIFVLGLPVKKVKIALDVVKITNVIPWSDKAISSDMFSDSWSCRWDDDRYFIFILLLLLLESNSDFLSGAHANHLCSWQLYDKGGMLIWYQVMSVYVCALHAGKTVCSLFILYSVRAGYCSINNSLLIRFHSPKTPFSHTGWTSFSSTYT